MKHIVDLIKQRYSDMWSTLFFASSPVNQVL